MVWLAPEELPELPLSELPLSELPLSELPVEDAEDPNPVYTDVESSVLLAPAPVALAVPVVVLVALTRVGF